MAYDSEVGRRPLRDGEAGHLSGPGVKHDLRPGSQAEEIAEQSRVDETARRIGLRLNDQARDNWLEFAVIVASADLLLALVLAGRVGFGQHSVITTMVAAGIAAASTMAAMLAYYSIQVGVVPMFGPLRLGQVFACFLVTATQLALFLWPASVLNQPRASDLQKLEGLRHWLLFYALFTVAAAIGSWQASSMRVCDQVGGMLTHFEITQRRDRKVALAAGAAALISWATTLRFPLFGLGLGVSWTLVASVGGLVTQSRVVSRLSADVEGHLYAPAMRQHKVKGPTGNRAGSECP